MLLHALIRISFSHINIPQSPRSHPNNKSPDIHARCRHNPDNPLCEVPFFHLHPLCPHLLACLTIGIDLYFCRGDHKSSIYFKYLTNSQLCSQRWKIVSTGDGYYEFIPACSGRYAIYTYSNKTTIGTNLALWNLINSDTQKFIVMYSD